MRNLTYWGVVVVTAALLVAADWYLIVLLEPTRSSAGKPRSAWGFYWLAATALFVVGFIPGAAFARQQLFGRLQPVLLGCLALVPVVAWRAVAIAKDVSADPTSHNLWPFEFVIIAVIGVAPCVAGAVTGRVLAPRNEDRPSA